MVLISVPPPPLHIPFPKSFPEIGCYVNKENNYMVAMFEANLLAAGINDISALFLLVWYLFWVVVVSGSQYTPWVVPISFISCRHISKWLF